MIASAILAICTLLSVPETWELKMRLYIPRVADNTQSLGFRKYQWQTIHGYFTVNAVHGYEPEIAFCSLVNLTHRVNGECVTYDAFVSDDCGTGVIWHGIGSNCTGDFHTRSVSLRVWAEPSYSIGPEPTEDNSLILTLSGYGNATATQIRGYAAGQQGCGCKEYGHVSPTRIWCTTNVMDTAAVFGQWRARRVE